MARIRNLSIIDVTLENRGNTKTLTEFKLVNGCWTIGIYPSHCIPNNNVDNYITSYKLSYDNGIIIANIDTPISEEDKKRLDLD